jgi:hypothetical protein
MNAAIIQEIKQRTNCDVHYEITNGVTHYRLTKPVAGKPTTVVVDIDAATHASTDASGVTDTIAKHASIEFGKLRSAPLDKTQ